MSLIEDFIYNGFFSEYLPEEFSLENPNGKSLLEIWESDRVSENSINIEPLSFNMSRFDKNSRRRTIYLPEITSYIKLVVYIKENNLLEELIEIAKDEHSFSPILKNGNEFSKFEQIYNIEFDKELSNMGSNYICNIIDKIKQSKGAKGILYLDIANFYLSIYTHLFPVLKVGYENAQQMFLTGGNDEEYLIYKRLDELVRQLNGKRTNGILPGLLLSRIISEALLSCIDKEIENKGINFARYVDDYEIFIYDENDIDKIENTISDILRKYFLMLNSQKTRYEKFPYYVVDNLDKILCNYIEDKLKPEELMELFNQFFKMENEHKGIIRYLLKSISAVNEQINYEDKELFKSYLIDILVNNARSLIKVCEIFIKNKDELDFNKIDQEIINNILLKNIESNNHLEVIWLVYLIIKIFGNEINLDIVEKIFKSDNDLAKIIILSECEKKHIEEYIGFINKDSMSWILGYQLYYLNYITINDLCNFIKISKQKGFYKCLKEEMFSFYKKNEKTRDVSS